MAEHAFKSVVRRLHALVGEKGVAVCDRDLLKRFVERRDESAFATLVHRHGPMVLAVCQRRLNNAHLAEDAFQATFLVLARKAESLRQRGSLAGWLHTVASYIALRCRSRRQKRQEISLLEDPPAVSTDPAWRELRPILDDEIGRLPPIYRETVVLCYLEGRTDDEAARQLGCPRGTVHSRLSRARELLRRRLTRRGLALAATGALLEAAPVRAAPSESLTAAACKAGVALRTGAAAVVSDPVLTLAKGAMNAMFWKSLSLPVVLTSTMMVLGIGGYGWFADGRSSTNDASALAAPMPELPFPRDMPDSPTARDHAQWIRALDGDDADARDRAERWLLEDMPYCYKELLAAIRGKNPAVRDRAQAVFDRYVESLVPKHRIGLRLGGDRGVDPKNEAWSLRDLLLQHRFEEGSPLRILYGDNARHRASKVEVKQDRDTIILWTKIEHTDAEPSPAMFQSVALPELKPGRYRLIQKLTCEMYGDREAESLLFRIVPKGRMRNFGWTGGFQSEDVAPVKDLLQALVEHPHTTGVVRQQIQKLIGDK